MPRPALAGNPLLGLLLLCIVALCGCEPIAHITWSPDGARAAYFVPTPGKLLPGVSYVIDANGKSSANLGPTFGTYAWSNDSKSFYFGAYDKSPPATPPVIRRWLVDAEDQPQAE